MSILGLVRDVVTGAPEFAALLPETPVCWRALTAERSVPTREYEALVAARRSWTVAEAGPAIMDTCGDKYERRNGLHFSHRGSHGHARGLASSHCCVPRPRPRHRGHSDLQRLELRWRVSAVGGLRGEEVGLDANLGSLRGKP